MALARANGWDVSVVRIVALIGFFCTSGLVGVAYVAAWIGIPDEISNPGAYPPAL
jgi:phage shock protein PspC (stress-responsive transcriptional regulator)